MCLDTITRKFKGRSRKIVYGYKAFRVENGNLRFEYGNIDGNKEVLTGAWLQATDDNERYQPYAAGFHVFPKKQQAEAWGKAHIWTRYIVLRVRCKGLLVEGDGLGGKTLVFKNIYVPRQKNP